MHYRRFGRTELRMPVLSCGGMRYQESWKDVEEVSAESQANVDACIRRAVALGITHIETARGYGSSEYQLGKILPQLKRDEIIVQTKIGPSDDVEQFEKSFERSMRLLHLDYVDLLAFHGVNGEVEYERLLKCLDKGLEFKRQGRVRHLGFSTHADVSWIRKTIALDVLEYVNLHWYYVFQENWPAIEDAKRHDMGVFIISPHEKGGMLFRPSKKLMELCAPLHPLVFNGVFCLSHPEVHTLSCGVAKPEEFDLPMGIVAHLDQAKDVLPPIVARLESALAERLGDRWATTWREGLPEWHETPGEVNIPMILRLRNLALAYDMLEYGKFRYNLLGNGGSWFPGQNAAEVEKLDLAPALRRAPHREEIPAALAEAHALLKGEERKRLQE